MQKWRDDCQRTEIFLKRSSRVFSIHMNALPWCISMALLCKSSCNLMYSTLCEGHNVTIEAAALWHPREKERKIKPCHTITQSVCGNRASGQAEEDEEAEKAAMSNSCQSLSLSLSLAAARGVSGQHFPALTRWLPGFQFQAPADIMRRQHVKNEIPAVLTISCTVCAASIHFCPRQHYIQSSLF